MVLSDWCSSDGALRGRLPDDLQPEEEEQEAAGHRQEHEETDAQGPRLPRRITRLLRAQSNV